MPTSSEESHQHTQPISNHESIDNSEFIDDTATPLVNNNPIRPQYYFEEILSALQTLKLPQGCVYQFDSYLIPSAVIPTNAWNEQKTTQIIVPNCDAHNTQLRRAVLEHTNGQIFGDNRYKQDAVIIKINENYTEHTIFKSTVSTENSITYLNNAQLKDFCQNNTCNNGFGLDITQSGILTVSFIVTCSNIDIYYSEGDGFMNVFDNSNTFIRFGLGKHLKNIVQNMNETKTKMCQLDLHRIVQCFMENNIDICYFQQPQSGQRLQFIHLLKRYCDIKASHAQHMFDKLHKKVSPKKTMQKPDLSNHDCSDMAEYQLLQLQKKDIKISKSLFVSEFLENEIQNATRTYMHYQNDKSYKNMTTFDASLLFSNIFTIFMIVMADYLHVMSCQHTYAFANEDQYQFGNVSKRSLLKPSFDMFEEYTFLPTQSNKIIKHGAEGTNSTSPKSAKKGDTQKSNDGNDNGSVAESSNNTGAVSSGDGGGDRKRNNDDAGDDRKKDKNAKNDADIADEEESKDEEKDEKTAKSLLNANACEFSMTRSRLGGIEEEDTMGPGTVYISKAMTEMIPEMIAQNIANIAWFMNKSLALQQNKFIHDKIGIINFDFTQKNNANQILYCVVILQENNHKSHKWKMIDRLFTETEIEKRYKIARNKLPKSIRNNSEFIAQLQCKPKLQIESVIHRTKWNKIAMINRKNNKQRLTLSITKTEFIKILNTQIMRELIPILIFGKNNNTFHIEYIWIVEIEGNHVGIAFKNNNNKSVTRVSGIHLCKEYISNAHTLVYPNHSIQCQCLAHFKSNIDVLHIGNVDETKNQNKHLRKVNTLLKDRICELESYISELKQNKCECLLDSATTPIQISKEEAIAENESKYEISNQKKPKNINICIAKDIKPTLLSNTPNSEIITPTPTLSTVPTFPTLPTISSVNVSKSMLSDVSAQSAPNPSTGFTLPQMPSIAPYNACPNYNRTYVPTLPILIYPMHMPPPSHIPTHTPLLPTNRCVILEQNPNINIPQTVTMKLLKSIEWNMDSEMLFYYIKHTINLQISHKCAYLFNNDLIIINTDLCDKISQKRLYAIIGKTNAKNKHKWELMDFYDCDTIYNQFMIRILPSSFRNNLDFALNIQYLYSNIDYIKLKSLNVIRNNKIHSAMNGNHLRECIKTGMRNNTNNLIPILRFKQQKSWIEHVLICETFDKKYNFGIAFKSEHKCVRATAIFVDRFDIERQHLLTANIRKYEILKNFRSGMNITTAKKKSEYNA